MITYFRGGMDQHMYVQTYLFRHQRPMENSLKKELNEEFSSHIDIVTMDNNYSLTESYFHLSF